MDSFLDTNIPLSYVFSIEPNNVKAEKIFNEYDKYFWSNNVKAEFDNRFDKKYTILSSFFNDFHYHVEKSYTPYFTIGIMNKFARDWDYDSEKQKTDILRATKDFWNKYLPYNHRPSKDELEIKLSEFLRDLNGRTYLKAERINNCFEQEIIRNKEYPKLLEKFTKLGMDECDKLIVLDAHDYGINHPLDFITFDNLCSEGASIEGLSFNKVLGQYDF